jgi:hypothetical protein
LTIRRKMLLIVKATRLIDHASTLRLQYKAEVSFMSQNHPIELPEDIFVALLRIAEQKGVTPADWIASQIPAAFFSERGMPTLRCIESDHRINRQLDRASPARIVFFRF